MDIWAESGILVYYESMIDLVTQKNYGTMRDVLLKELEEAKEGAEQAVEENAWQKDHYETTKGLMKPLLDEDSLEGVIEILKTYDKPSGEVENRYDDCEAMYGAQAQEAWSVFLEKEYPGLPALVSVEAFGASRISGGEVPVGVVVYVFSEAECYEKIPTEQGKRLFDLVGEVEPSSWTIYSV